MSPYKKLGNGKYRSPSGKVMTLKQIQAYEAEKERKRVKGK